uniref:Polymerase basic protein 2 n=1 Tax=Chum salmon influenza-like virus TaxID=2777032 RepID=A0A866VUB7_9ORTO|nr:polymerase basic 2 [Chum salmon influenza-like virus]
MTLAKIKALKELLKDKNAKHVLRTTTVDNFSVIRKFTTSRQEKNPSLRMKWAMASNFPIALKTSGEEIPLVHGGVKLRLEEKEDLGTRGAMVSNCAVTWWNTHGPVGDVSGFRKVYEAYFERRDRVLQGQWGPVKFGPVEKVRRRVLLNPVKKEMPMDEAIGVIMEVIFPREAGIPRESVMSHKKLIKEKRELLAGTLIQPVVLAQMLERELVARRRFLPVSGATAAEYIELLHCSQGDNWKLPYIPGHVGSGEARGQTMIVACRQIVRRAVVSAHPKETAVEIAMKTQIEGEELKATLAAVDGGDVACDIIRTTLGMQVKSRLRFGGLELKRVSGKAQRSDENVMIGNGTIIRMGIWVGYEEFHVRWGNCRGILQTEKFLLKKLIISDGEMKEKRELIINCMVFSQDERMFECITGQMNFLSRAGQELPPMYQMQRYFRNRGDDLLKNWGMEPLPGVAELRGIDPYMNESNDTLKRVVVTKSKIDDFTMSVDADAFVDEQLIVRKRNGDILFSPQDVSEVVSQPSLSITYESSKMWELGTTREVVTNTYKWIAKNLMSLKKQFVSGKLDMFKWDALEAFQTAVPTKMAGKYSAFCRSILEEMSKNGEYNTEQFLKLLPFCYPEPATNLRGKVIQFSRLQLKDGGENIINVRGASSMFAFNNQSKVLTINGRNIDLSKMVDEEESSADNAVLSGFLVVGRMDPLLGPPLSAEELVNVKRGEYANVLLYHGLPVRVTKRKRECAISSDVAEGVKRQRTTIDAYRN